MHILEKGLELTAFESFYFTFWIAKSYTPKTIPNMEICIYQIKYQKSLNCFLNEN